MFRNLLHFFFLLKGITCQYNNEMFVDSGSGSGQVIDQPIGRDQIPYSAIEIKFGTKFNFEYKSGTNMFYPEVLEELTYALNEEGFEPMTGVLHRPAITSQRSDIKLEGSQSSPALRFKTTIQIPKEVDSKDYFERLLRSPSGFFTLIKAIPNKAPMDVFKTEEELLNYEREHVLRKRKPNVMTEVETVMPDTDIGTKDEGESKSPADDRRPTVDVEITPVHVLLNDKLTLAAIIAGAVAGFVCTVVCTAFVVYRMRKKDEGSYKLNEPKAKYKNEVYNQNHKNKEFFA